MIDGYKVFMEKFNISNQQMIEFGINETIFVSKKTVEQEWNKLKRDVFEGNKKIYVRGYGRDAKGTNLYMNLYKQIFDHSQFYKDANNNAEPTKVIKRLTGYSRQEKPTNKYKQIRNYQVSHIFGKTKNPFSFTAPWNIVYIPKIMDPFTGHESKGSLSKEFKKQFHLHFYHYYQEYIEEFNAIMSTLKPTIEEYLEGQGEKTSEKFKEDAVEQFSPLSFKLY